MLSSFSRATEITSSYNLPLTAVYQASPEDEPALFPHLFFYDNLPFSSLPSFSSTSIMVQGNAIHHHHHHHHRYHHHQYHHHQHDHHWCFDTIESAASGSSPGSSSPPASIPPFLLKVDTIWFKDIKQIETLWIILETSCS